MNVRKLHTVVTDLIYVSRWPVRKQTCNIFLFFIHCIQYYLYPFACIWICLMDLNRKPCMMIHLLFRHCLRFVPPFPLIPLYIQSHFQVWWVDKGDFHDLILVPSSWALPSTLKSCPFFSFQFRYAAAFFFVLGSFLLCKIVEDFPFHVQGTQTLGLSKFGLCSTIISYIIYLAIEFISFTINWI